MAHQVPAARVAEVRGFNRFFTNAIGVLGEGLLGLPYSLTEARLIFELAQRRDTEVVELRRTLDMDAGYLSRLLSRFAADGLITKTRSSVDARRQVVRLTRYGRRVFARLDARSTAQVEAMLSRLTEENRRRLVTAMKVIQETLQERTAPEVYVIRPPRSGDWGWLIQRHGSVYADEYGWDETFEALVARIVADYIDHRDPAEKQPGSPRSTVSRSGASCACDETTTSHSCGCCWSTPTHAVWASAPVSCRNACASPPRPATSR